MSYPTTRMFSRTLGQAFADERAVCVYLPLKRIGYMAVNWTIAAAVVFLILLFSLEGF